MKIIFPLSYSYAFFVCFLSYCIDWDLKYNSNKNDHSGHPCLVPKFTSKDNVCCKTFVNTLSD